jgi:hypothetical protein
VAVRDWHPGQVAVIWIGGALAEWVTLGLLRGGDLGDSAAPLLIVLFFAIPLAVLVVTWIWFGSRPRSR